MDKQLIFSDGLDIDSIEKDISSLYRPGAPRIRLGKRC